MKELRHRGRSVLLAVGLLVLALSACSEAELVESEPSEPHPTVSIYRVNAADLGSETVEMRANEPILFGASCRSGPVGRVSAPGIVQVGDMVSAGDYSFRVGIIKIHQFNRDFVFGGETIARAGDIQCVLAEDERALPSDDDCEALWLYAPSCMPIG